MGNFDTQDVLTFCKASHSVLLAASVSILIHYLAVAQAASCIQKIGFVYVALAVLEFTVQTRLPSNSEIHLHS
ncbi:hypothetical protein STEG23_025733 [Scotinomys teguina]